MHLCSARVHDTPKLAWFLSLLAAIVLCLPWCLPSQLSPYLHGVINALTLLLAAYGIRALCFPQVRRIVASDCGRWYVELRARGWRQNRAFKRVLVKPQAAQWHQRWFSVQFVELALTPTASRVRVQQPLRVYTLTLSPCHLTMDELKWLRRSVKSYLQSAA